MKKISIFLIILLVSCAEDLSQKAKEYSQNKIIIDSHIDTPFQIWRQKNNTGVSDDITKTTSYHFDYPRAIKGGLNLPFFAIYIPARTEPEGTSFELAVELIEMMNKIISDNSDKFTFIRDPSDISILEKNKNLVGIAYGIENGAPIEGKLENIKYFADLGVNYITLAHSKSNHISDSSYDENKRWKDGLSPFGFEVVKEMNKQGVMIDISHVSDAAFMKVLEISETPVIATHSSLRHFTPGWERNVSDEMLIALAKNNGVLQICFGSGFVADTKSNPDMIVTVKNIVDNIDRVKNLVGIDHVGLGSDFDGEVPLPEDINDVSKFPNLIEELLVRGYSESEIDQILNGNFLRVWKAVKEFSKS